MYRQISFLILKVVLSALIACGTAAPSASHSHDQYAYAGPVATYAASAPVLLQEYQHLPAVAKVAEYVEHVPSSVSHQSSSVVHSSAAVATPVLHAAPIRTIETLQATPIVEEIHEAQFVDAFHAAPVLKEAAYAKVAEYVEHVPSSVSHHSSSVVHSSAAVATPVITPVAKTVVATAPIYKAAPAPILHAAPILKEVHGVAHDIVEVRPEIQYAAAAPAYAKVGEFVEHVPSSVSHHSSSVVHNSAAVATPVITPVAKTVVSTAPVYRAAPAAYAIHEAPLYNSLPYAAYNHGPAYYAHNQPILRSW